MTNLIGVQIDQYLIEKLIARGGMAEVYLATDVSLQRQVAFKVMLSELAVDQTATARFRREAEAVARLNHPNIIQIYTTGTTPDNRSYLAMQYVSGGTLQQKLAESARQGRALPAGDALYLARQVAAALEVAHRQNIVHRDLKPSNILLHTNGEPVITDLGIAAVETGQTRLTQTGNVMGTPHYMAPEQASGQRVDGRTDIYALGVILYEMLSGHVPFEAGSPLAVLHQHINAQPPSLAQVRPGLSRSTYQTVDICLQKDPDGRFQTAGQLVAALDHSLLSEGLRTPQAVATYPDVRPPQKRRWRPIVVAGAAVLVILLLSLGYLRATDSWPFDSWAAADEATPTISVVTATSAVAVGTQPTPVPSTTAAPTDTAVITEMVVTDPGCPGSPAGSPYIAEDGGVCFGEAKILDLESEAAGCFEVGEIPNSPTAGYFAVVLQCFEGDNEVFIFRADGSEKRRVTGQWDYVNYDEYTWTADGYFVYRRINSCCVEPPPDAPPEGVVWYQPERDLKEIFDTLSPLVPYRVVNVAADDVLNIRAQAGADSAIGGWIPPDGSGVLVSGLSVRRDGDKWVPVRYQEQAGWVNGYYLQPESGSSPTPTPVATADVSAVFLSSAPIVDGSLDEWPATATFSSSHIVNDNDSWDGSDDIEAVWQLGWDNSNLYLAVTVYDDIHVQTRSDTKIWQGDSVEVQLDMDPADSGQELNSDDFQLNASPGDFQSVSSYHYLSQGAGGRSYNVNIPQSIAIAARSGMGAGYTMEIAIPWSDLRKNPGLGDAIGIALNVSDNDGPGTANQEVLKSSAQERSYYFPDTWGRLSLQG